MLSRRHAFALSVLTIILAAFSQSPGAQEISIDIDPNRITVTICLSDTKPTISFPRHNRQLLPRLDTAEANCAAYQFLYQKALKVGSRWLKKQEETYITRANNWLIMANNANEEDIRIRLNHPPNWQVSHPWQAHHSSHGFLAKTNNFDWPTVLAFGQLHQKDKVIGQQTLRIAYSTAIAQQRAAQLVPWLTRSIGALHKRFPNLPPRQTQILVSPSRGNEPVPFGQVLRGGEGSVHFYINDRYPLTQFLDDWTAYHEVSHLLLPFIDRDDAWLSEGFASYWQYLLMVDSGQIDVDTFWRRFYGGIRRGEASWRRTKAITLSEATANMFSNGAVRRAYWSGAIVFFNLDVSLRQRKDAGPTSLAEVISVFNVDTQSRYRVWSAEKLGRALDTASQSTRFSKAFRDAAREKNFPAYRENFAAFGVFPEGKNLTLEPRLKDKREAFVNVPIKKE